MSDLSTLRMPPHTVEWTVGGTPQDPYNCKAGREPGYAHMNPDGTLHCNACGWVTDEPVVTSYSPDTDKTYLTWDELIAAESNGYVVVGTSERPGTVPVVIGPWPASEAGKQEARKAQARLRPRWRREEAPHKMHTYVRVLWKEGRSRR